MRVFAITIAYNETFFLPRWTAYYGAQLGLENLFVVDHGSTDLSTRGLGAVNVVRVPRDAYDEVQRIEFAARLHAALLCYYDAGFVADTDEFLVADPTRFAGLREFAEKSEHDAPACVGLELYHARGAEPAFRPTLPILYQRRHALFDSWMCKRSFARKPIRFGGGLHTSDQPVVFDPGLYLIHLKNFDYDHRLVRQGVTASWTYAGDYGEHARRSLDHVESDFARVDRMVADGRISYDMDFSEEIEKCLQRTMINPSGEYDFNLHGGFSATDLRILPAAFHGLF